MAAEGPGGGNAPVEAYLPQPGTDVYYAQRYAPAAQRPLLGLIEALRGEIARVPATCSTSDIAVAKLAWWREEIARFAHGTPRHRVTQALAPALPALPALVPAAVALVDGIVALLDTTRHPTRASRSIAFDRAHGPLWGVINALTTALDADEARHARLLGSRVEEAYALRDTRRFVTSGAALLAQDSIAASGRAAAQNADPADADWYARVMHVDIVDCRGQLAAELVTLPCRRRLRPLATLTRIAIATLDEVLADGCRVWERRIELTPLRKLGLALWERAGI